MFPALRGERKFEIGSLFPIAGVRKELVHRTPVLSRDEIPDKRATKRLLLGIARQVCGLGVPLVNLAREVHAKNQGVRRLDQAGKVVGLAGHLSDCVLEARDVVPQAEDPNDLACAVLSRCGVDGDVNVHPVLRLQRDFKVRPLPAAARFRQYFLHTGVVNLRNKILNERSVERLLPRITRDRCNLGVPLIHITLEVHTEKRRIGGFNELLPLFCKAPVVLIVPNQLSDVLPDRNDACNLSCSSAAH
mmetsp:Transcript_79193/g.224463  ORF Transcript_79193/g.224463 Transcript_79193/m.224463 type:complete len:247 (-) Transcript_79193:744-1484(-)